MKKTYQRNFVKNSLPGNLCLFLEFWILKGSKIGPGGMLDRFNL